MNGIIDVGGGMRGVYAAGVLDRCLEKGHYFDLCIGISAGSANLASYIARQRGRSYTFYTRYAFRREYMSLRNFLFKKSFFDLDYVYSTLSNSWGENPLDYKTFRENPAQFLVVASEAQTGKTKYFTKNDIRFDRFDVLKASSAIPFVCKPVRIGGIPYYDGALADPVPVEKAFSLGCDKVVLILTKPRDLIRNPKRDLVLAKRVAKKYPLAAKNLSLRAERYNEGVGLAKKYEAKGKLLIVAPKDTCGVDTLKRDPQSLERLYRYGLDDAEAIESFLKG